MLLNLVVRYCEVDIVILLFLYHAYMSWSVSASISKVTFLEYPIETIHYQLVNYRNDKPDKRDVVSTIKAKDCPNQNGGGIIEIIRQRRQFFENRVANDISEASRIRSIIISDNKLKKRPRKDTGGTDETLHRLDKSIDNKSGLAKLAHKYESIKLEPRVTYLSKTADEYGTTYHDRERISRDETVETASASLRPFSSEPDDFDDKFSLLGAKDYK